MAEILRYADLGQGSSNPTSSPLADPSAGYRAPSDAPIVVHCKPRNSRISIIIPAKHELKYLPRTLRHLVRAREKMDLEFEIIVVASNDTEPTVLEEYDLADVLLLESPAGTHSIARARNLGAEFASSEFLFHTDADVIVPDVHSFLKRALAHFQDPKLQALTTRIEPYPTNVRRVDAIMHWLANSIIRISFSFHVNFARGECQIVRSSAFTSIGGYDEAIIVGEDWDLFRRLRKSTGRVGFVKSLNVFHSTRRFRAYGYPRTVLLYIREGFYIIFFHKSFLDEWESVR